MKNKFTLKESEIQRILGLHKKSILKETKITPINEETKKSYPITLKKRDGNNSGGLKANDVVTKINKVKNFNSDLVELEVELLDGPYDVSFDCKTPDIMVLDGSQTGGSEYRVGPKFKSLIKWYCAGKPKKDKGNEGSSSGSEEKPSKSYAYTYIPKQKFKTSEGDMETKGEYIYFKCIPYKQSYHFKYGTSLYNNDTLTKTFKKVFCDSNKSSYTTIEPRTLKGINVQNENVSMPLLANTKWNWKLDSSDLKKTNEDPQKTEKAKNCGHASWDEYKASGWKCNVKQKVRQKIRRGTSSETYPFNFDEVMKAINNTGKCSATQPTQPTPTPTPEIDTTISNDMYQTLTSL